MRERERMKKLIRVEKTSHKCRTPPHKGEIKIVKSHEAKTWRTEK